MKAVRETARIDEAHDALSGRIKLQLSAKHHYELSKLLVSCRRGIVRLSGSVSSFHVRQLALAVTIQVEGVRHIVDEIHVVETHSRSKRKRR
jgi:osmotically-inducible protein OsmY